MALQTVKLLRHSNLQKILSESITIFFMYLRIVPTMVPFLALRTSHLLIFNLPCINTSTINEANICACSHLNHMVRFVEGESGLVIGSEIHRVPATFSRNSYKQARRKMELRLHIDFLYILHEQH